MTTIPRAIGIDLGNTKSVMAVMRGDEPEVLLNRQGDPMTFSAVDVNRRGELFVGKQARAKRYGDTIHSIKRFMGLPYQDVHVQDALKHVAYKVSEGPGGEVQVHFNGRTYSPPEISAIILQRLRVDASLRLGEPVGRAVITVPAYFNDAQVAATRKAAWMAGFMVMRILREPTAAALAFGVDREKSSEDSDDMLAVLVYNLGSSAFDVSISMIMQGQFHVLSIEGDKFLGGDNFDEEIMRYIVGSIPGGKVMMESYAARRQLRGIAEDAKKELSSVDEVSISGVELAGLAVECDLSRSDFELMVRRYVDETIELTHRVMREAHVTADMVDYVVLVGGSTLIPIVRETLRKEFGKEKIRNDIDPMLCVAYGAAVQTSMIDEIGCPNPECHDEDGQPTRNPLEATACERCHTSLVGFETVICTTCFVPNEASQQVCRKCKSRLDGKQEGSVASPVRAPDEETHAWRCWNCEFPENPAGVDTCQFCGADREAGGLKCPKCGQLNPPGRDTCAKCGANIGSVLVNVTPEDIGVELEDGSMAVLIPKNTAFPTPSAHVVSFHTVEAGQRQVTWKVYQGHADRAEDNEYLGTVVFDLPPNLPRGTEITLALGLDNDGTGVFTVYLREYPSYRATAHFIRAGRGAALC